MSLLDKLERRFGFLSIPNLGRVLVAFTALVFALSLLAPGYLTILDLDPTRIRHGEVWRVVTYIFIPNTQSPLWILFALWFLWWITEGLERAIGSFRITLYFLIGMIGTTAAAFFFGTQFSNRMLMSSLFFAFARFYGDEIIYLIFILPVKIKWLAWFYGAILLFYFITESNLYRVSFLAAFANYFIFFGGEIWREARHRRDVTTRRRRYESDSRSDHESLHKCAVCGATELSDPNLEFRVARDGEEYCIPHLPSAATS
jgi:hypothetical protein